MNKLTHCPICLSVKTHFNGTVYVLLPDDRYFQFSKLWLHLIEQHRVMPPDILKEIIEHCCLNLLTKTNWSKRKPEETIAFIPINGTSLKECRQPTLPEQQLTKLKCIILASDRMMQEK